jgi:hypothetical protein
MNVPWKGVFPAITTQFRPDQSLDLAATARHLEALIRAGIHGVVFLGTVGENTALEYLPLHKINNLQRIRILSPLQPLPRSSLKEPGRVILPLKQ